MTKNTVVINGKLYNADTGLPVTDGAPIQSPARQPLQTEPKKVVTPRPAPQSSSFINELSGIVAKTPAQPAQKPTSADRIKAQRPAPIHVNAKKPARSQTLNRQFVTKPSATTVASHQNDIRRSIATSPMVSKFGQPQVAKRAPEPNHATKPIDKPAIKNDLVAKAEQNRVAAPVASKPTNSRELKDALIKEQMDKPHVAKKEVRKKRRFSAFTIATAAFALVLMGGYFTYMNMPSLSVRVAASRAGVNAKYPEYNPSGYSIDGPVAFAPGQVTINYKSNSNAEHYTISQQNSSWDSDAVLENKVERDNPNYQTLSQKGLTVYKYGNKAAWVNGGVLYSIDGNASLSTEQVLRIVDSI